MHELVFSGGTYDHIVEHALDGVPEEVCGVLAGERDSEPGVTRVDAVYRTANAAAAPATRYAIDPQEQLDVMDSIERDGLDVAGFYHSHPMGPSVPSDTDVDDATWTGYPYVIVALDGACPFVGAWEWTGESFDGLVVSRTPAGGVSSGSEH